jgi:D-alanine-D-alanine ligase
MGARSRGKGGKVAILHGAVAPDAAPDEQDVLVEVETVATALAALGYRPVPLPLGLDLAAAGRRLARLKPDFVFNLVESLEGQGRLIHLVPSLLDSLGLAYTGSGAEAIYLTSNKPLAKRLLRGEGIATPDWAAAGELPHFPGPYIVKSVWEHASIGLEDGSVTGDIGALPTLLEERRRRLGGEWFVEAFVEGREFNLSLLGGPQDMQLLPPAEMCFVGYPAGKPRIINYAAKWDEHSFEFHATPRRFDFGAEDGDLLRRLAVTAEACWRLFDLRGYARVDCRIDGRGEVQVLEVNINPCLSPDAGFAAAAAQAGLDLPGIVARIIADRAEPVSPRPVSHAEPPARSLPAAAVAFEQAR